MYLIDSTITKKIKIFQISLGVVSYKLFARVSYYKKIMNYKFKWLIELITFSLWNREL